jgi:ubiquinone/menaquinone biosynthesis C-methylase UbiE
MESDPLSQQETGLRSRLRSRLLEWGVLGFEIGRGAHFLAQMRALQLITRLAIPGGFPTRVRQKSVEDELIGDLLQLFREEARLFGEGSFPLAMLKPEGPVRHGLRAAALLMDGVRLIRQKRAGRTTEFSEEARVRAEEKPRYYRRNFHFQNGGYLSSRSAELYEHQVEILFTGAADAMRRLVLRPMLERWGAERASNGGRGLRILEVAAGTGRTSRFIKQLLPQAHLTVSDLSEVYLKKARRELASFDHVDFVEAAAEALPFQAGQFDAVVSVFLFHELPLEVRQKVLAEKRRVAKPGGLIAAVDSVQPHDLPQYAAVLEQFPKDFHEPFFRNYLENPLEGLLEQAGVGSVVKQTGFVSKLVHGGA